MKEAALTLPLQLTLADVARLANVRRPVVSVWRSRSAGSALPFPQPFATVRGEDRFDAEVVVDWLEVTERGNNPDVRADLAAFAWPKGMSGRDDEIAFNGLAALLCLKEVSGERLAALSDDDLLDLCDEVDPDDELLMSEIDLVGERRTHLCVYADTLADASYSCAEAFEQLIRERLRFAPSGLTGVPLHKSARDLVSALASALALDAGIEPAVYVDPTRGGSDLIVSLLRRGDEFGAATVMTARHQDAASRQARRRLRVHGVRCQLMNVNEDGSPAIPTPAVHLAQYPSPGIPTMTDEGILTEIDNLALQMDDTHRAVVIAPAGVLSDRIRDRSAEAIRDGLLRLGRVRGVVRLPKGLVPNKPRQALALWALGPAHDDVAVQDRWTMVADLTDTELDPAATSDLVNDLIVTMADRATVGAHAFRFARPVPTRNLLAGRGDLVARGTSVPRPPRAAASHLAVRIAELRGALSDTTSHTGLDFQVRVTERVEVARTVVPLDELVAAGQVRLIPGNRLDPGGLPGGAVHLVDAEDLATGVRHGARNVDRVALFAKHPGCRLTEPGDVVFCTSPRPAAWVDEEGGSVVLAPARTLRVHQQSRRGLHPRLLATDINAVPSERREWRTWPVRQVPPAEQPALADVLMNIEQERISTISRLARLGELERLVIRGVANGSLTLTAETHL